DQRPHSLSTAFLRSWLRSGRGPRGSSCPLLSLCRFQPWAARVRVRDAAGYNVAGDLDRSRKRGRELAGGLQPRISGRGLPARGARPAGRGSAGGGTVACVAGRVSALPKPGKASPATFRSARQHPELTRRAARPPRREQPRLPYGELMHTVEDGPKV